MVDGSIPKSIMGQVVRAMKGNPGAIVTLLDAKGVFLFASPSVTDILGFTPEDGVGHSFSEFYDAGDEAHVALAIQDTLLNGRSVEVTRTARTKSGGRRRMRGFGRKLVDSGTANEYILSLSWPVDSSDPNH